VSALDQIANLIEALWRENDRPTFARDQADVASIVLAVAICD
jgi:hypothetical protein